MDAPDDFYSIALKELTSRNPVPGVFARAIADSGGDEAKTRALYIKYRVARLQEEVRARAEAMRREEKERKEQEVADRERRRKEFIAEYPGAETYSDESIDDLVEQLRSKAITPEQMRAQVHPPIGFRVPLIILGIVSLLLLILALSLGGH